MRHLRREAQLDLNSLKNCPIWPLSMEHRSLQGKLRIPHIYYRCKSWLWAMSLCGFRINYANMGQADPEAGKQVDSAAEPIFWI